MTAPLRVAVRQGSPEWLSARRELITATDLPVILGLSPWRCEADLADEKLNGVETEPTLRMRLGNALEPLIAEEYTAQTGRAVRRYHGLLRHPRLAWAGASPDWQVVGERRLVEGKWSASRGRFADGLPDDIAAQAAWQMFVADVPVADVAVLVAGEELRIFEVERDSKLEADLVAVAQDFRRRLAAGGPFARDTARIKRDYPADDGSEMLADAGLTAAVKALVDTRESRKRLEANETAIEDAIKTRMGPASRLTGDGFAVTWKRTKDVTTTDWKSLADGLLRQLPEAQREPLIGLHSAVREGFRPFRVVVASKED